MQTDTEKPVKRRLRAKRRTRRLKGCLVWLGGALLLLFFFAFAWEALIATGILPCQVALPGDEVHPRILAKLKRAGVIQRDERVLYFCSERFFSIGSGSLCTDKRAIAYDGLGRQLELWTADYGEIANFHWERWGVGLADSTNADSTIMVTKTDGSWFTLCVNSDLTTGRCRFMEILQERWEPYRQKAIPKASPAPAPMRR